MLPTQYTVILKNDKIQRYDRMALLLCIAQLTVFIVFAVYAEEKFTRIAAMGGAVLVAIALSVHFFLKRIRHNQGTPYLHAGLWLSTMTWISMLNWLAAAGSLVLELFYQQSKKVLRINFAPGKIELSAFTRKTIFWEELNQVILKDGLLTIDFRNNRIIQAEIMPAGKEINEDEFNEFCRQQSQPVIIHN
ncbi:MAG TPA: hypothetical protein VFX58_04850 [Chitinophagaceae bacterium]|nr:hypothetical protein [Chitinophagaceae bacterium]